MAGTPVRSRTFPALTGILAMAGTVSAALTWNGHLRTDTRLSLHSRYDFTRQEYRLSLKPSAQFDDRATFSAEAWVRYCDFAEIDHVDDLFLENRVVPVGLSLREAYLDIYGLGLDGLDARIGRQRIAWGKAYRINPTDNLNADDLEDMWDFGRHLASDGVRLTYYMGDFSIEGVYLPLFRPSVLPSGDWADALVQEPELDPGIEDLVELGSQSDTVCAPRRVPRESSTGGARLSGHLLGVDFSASYVYGRDDLPVVRKVLLAPTAPFVLGGALSVDATAQLYYPRMHVAGLDLAVVLGNVGAWAEAAVFFPEQVDLTARLTARPEGMPVGIEALLPPDTAAFLSGEDVFVETVLENTPYVKFVVGGDYTFANGLYVNVQYIHGFVHERADDVEDYLVVDARWDLLDERVTVAPFGIGLEVRDFATIADSYAALYQPEISVRPVDNVELRAGVRIVEGKDNSTFGALRESDEAYVRAQYTF